MMIVAGTCIGAGALGLPVLTGDAGFFPSLLLYLACWLTMACTGLLYLEICLWMGPEANILSMAGRFLGAVGKGVIWFVYLYLFYSLTVAYVVGSGGVVSGLMPMPHWLGILIFMLLFSPFVYFGPRAVDRANGLLVGGLGIAYAAFIAVGLTHVNPLFLERLEWSKMWLAAPVVLTSFGYQGTLPTLVDYLRRNPSSVRKAIWIGTSLPLIGYVIWEWLILGIVPPEGLQKALQLGQTAIIPLKEAVASRWVFVIGQFFAFFALTSSYLGVTLGMRDFLADGFKVKKTISGRLFLCLLIFVPAFVISLTDPRLFLLALKYGGGVGGVLLLGILPVMLVWIGRYRHQLESVYRMKGGRLSLILLACVVLGMLALSVVGDFK
ncbi:MAG: tyrosine transporter [Verrucomicrobia bacterium]|nr:tyrosine transporter [Verrucomicrobiota bacterium]